MDTTEARTPTENYVDSLLQLTGQLVLVVNHMAANENPEAEDPPNVALASLLCEMLQPEFEDRPDELQTAASIVDRSLDTIGRELFLVGPGALDDCAPAHLRSGRRRKRRR